MSKIAGIVNESVKDFIIIIYLKSTVSEIAYQNYFKSWTANIERSA